MADFRTFVSSCADQLIFVPGETVTIACNQAGSGIVAASAEALLKSRTTPWLERLTRPAWHARHALLQTYPDESDRRKKARWPDTKYFALSQDARFLFLESRLNMTAREIDNEGLKENFLRAWLYKERYADIEVYDLREGRKHRVILVPLDLRGWCADRSGGRVALVTTGGCLNVISVLGGETMFEHHHHKALLAVALSDDGSWALAADEDGTVLRWELGRERTIRQIRPSFAAVTELRFSGDAKRAFARGKPTFADRTEDTRSCLQVWDLTTGDCLSEVIGIGPRDHFTATPCTDGRLLAVGGIDGEITLSTIPGGQRLRRFKAP